MSINHIKNSYRIEANVGLRKELLSKLSLFIETNLVLSFSDSKGQSIKNEVPNAEPFSDTYYNPINSIGVLYQINQKK